VAGAGILAGKRGVIIGGTSGMGLATAKIITEWGGTVIPTSSNPEKVAAALKELNQKETFPALSLDVAHREAIFEWVEKTYQTWGKLDYLCYFAGVHKTTPIETLDEATLEQVMTVNAKGALWAAQAAFPYMKAQGRWGDCNNLFAFFPFGFWRCPGVCHQ
jgi:NADP-dependent 3-hydroxy acid dehydrogenase YdfG